MYVHVHTLEYDTLILARQGTRQQLLFDRHSQTSMNTVANPSSTLKRLYDAFSQGKDVK